MNQYTRLGLWIFEKGDTADNDIPEGMTDDEGYNRTAIINAGDPNNYMSMPLSEIEANELMQDIEFFAEDAGATLTEDEKTWLRLYLTTDDNDERIFENFYI